MTNKPWAKSLVIDKNGNKIQFVDELVGEEQRLVVYINRTPQLSFILVDVPITGRIKNPIPWDRNRIYYVLDNGKRYRSLYIDPVQKKIGSRHALRAVYTSESVGKKQQQFWRELRKLSYAS